MNGELPNNDGTDRATGAEPSAAEASRLLAQRLAREQSVVAHGTIPFRSGPDPEPDARRRRMRLAMIVAVVLVALVVAVAVALLLS